MKCTRFLVCDCQDCLTERHGYSDSRISHGSENPYASIIFVAVMILIAMISRFVIGA